MNFDLGLDLLLYGLALIGVSIFLHRTAADFAGIQASIGVICGGLTCFWGVLGLRGRPSTILPILTHWIIAGLLLVQGLAIFREAGDSHSAKKMLLVLFVLLVFALGQLHWLLRAGKSIPSSPQPAQRHKAEQHRANDCFREGRE